MWKNVGAVDAAGLNGMVVIGVEDLVYVAPAHGLRSTLLVSLQKTKLPISSQRECQEIKGSKRMGGIKMGKKMEAHLRSSSIRMKL